MINMPQEDTARWQGCSEHCHGFMGKCGLKRMKIKGDNVCGTMEAMFTMGLMFLRKCLRRNDKGLLLKCLWFGYHSNIIVTGRSTRDHICREGTFNYIIINLIVKGLKWTPTRLQKPLARADSPWNFSCIQSVMIWNNTLFLYLSQPITSDVCV